MKEKKLFPRIAVVYVSIVTVIFVIITSLLTYWLNQSVVNEKKLKIRGRMSYIKEITQDSMNASLNIERYREILRIISNQIDSDIIIVDQNKYIFATSSSRYDDYLAKQVLDKEFALIAKENYFQKVTSDKEIFGEGNYLLAEPVYSKDGKLVAEVVVIVDINAIKNTVRPIQTSVWVAGLLCIAVFCIVVYYFCHKFIFQPLREMTAVAKKIADGDVKKRINIKYYDEFGEFGSAFNAMADSLEMVENNRREFISNVSHELRSPITSIKGFIGGIIDDVIPPEKHKYYLQIAYEEIQRLTRLINDLLDLSSVESGTFKLNVKSVNINEIVRVCIIRNEARIKAKKLDVEVNFQEDEIMVKADEDKIIEVVTNLLDNAIKYVNVGKQIFIFVNKKGKKALVSIINQGPQINEEDLKHIWERFYKGDKSRTQKVSTGLGLAIVKKIITLHGEEIWVENTDMGVNFTFTLSLS